LELNAFTLNDPGWETLSYIVIFNACFHEVTIEIT
jgi:hypothetical protein